VGPPITSGAPAAPGAVGGGLGLGAAAGQGEEHVIHAGVAAGQVGVDGGVLAGEADAVADLLGLADHVQAEDLGAAAVGAQDGGEGEDADGGGLAGAGGAEQPEHGARRHLEVDAVEGHDLAESLADPWTTMGQRGRFFAILQEFGLSPGDLRALFALDGDQPRPMRALARAWNCDASNATWMVDRLETRGLVERRALLHDRRVKAVVLTPLGASTKRELLTRLHQPPDDFLALDAPPWRTCGTRWRSCRPPCAPPARTSARPTACRRIARALEAARGARLASRMLAHPLWPAARRRQGA
jgi:DNA-binding MarR family transcriptional regulator